MNFLKSRKKKDDSVNPHPGAVDGITSDVEAASVSSDKLLDIESDSDSVNLIVPFRYDLKYPIQFGDDTYDHIICKRRPTKGLLKKFMRSGDDEAELTYLMFEKYYDLMTIVFDEMDADDMIEAVTLLQKAFPKSLGGEVENEFMGMEINVPFSYELKFPFKSPSGQRITELVCSSRPKMKAMKAIMQAGDDEADVTDAIFETMFGVGPEISDLIDGEDTISATNMIKAAFPNLTGGN